MGNCKCSCLCFDNILFSFKLSTKGAVGNAPFRISVVETICFGSNKDDEEGVDFVLKIFYFEFCLIKSFEIISHLL